LPSLPAEDKQRNQPAGRHVHKQLAENQRTSAAQQEAKKAQAA